jgi:hypothetical protein
MVVLWVVKLVAMLAVHWVLMKADWKAAYSAVQLVELRAAYWAD